MSGRRIVLFGATGFTGRRVLATLLDRGQTPVLAGRSTAKLRALRESTGADLRVVQVDATDDKGLAAVIGPGDVVVSTVGPFFQSGHEIARAAAVAGAHYLDSTGEPPFIRWLFDHLDDAAQASGACLVPAFGYDYVPGNLAGALALERAAGSARHARVGYFLLAGGRLGKRARLRDSIRLTTGSTHASLAGVVAEPSFAYRAAEPGRWHLTTEGAAQRLHWFTVIGQRRPAVTVGGSEHFGLPQSFPELESVEVCLGWFAGMSRAVQLLSTTCDSVLSSPAGRRAMTVIARSLPTANHVPTAHGTSLVVAIALDGAQAPVCQVALAGTEPYQLTAELMAEAAVYAANNTMPPGAQGPVNAFGVQELASMAKKAGLVEVASST